MRRYFIPRAASLDPEEREFVAWLERPGDALMPEASPAPTGRGIRGGMTKPKLTEADVFFELFLPMLCAEKHKALAHFKGRVELRMGGEAPRVWNLTGGKPPWIQRGALETPDLVLSFAPSLVEDLVLGRDPDVKKAMADGRLEVVGDPKVLKAFELTLEEATGLVGTMLKR